MALLRKFGALPGLKDIQTSPPAGGGPSCMGGTPDGPYADCLRHGRDIPEG